jgi:hypothetical protein
LVSTQAFKKEKNKNGIRRKILPFIGLEDQFPGALKEDKFPAVIFAGATAAFGVVPGVIHISYELGFVAETDRPIVGRHRALLL